MKLRIIDEHWGREKTIDEPRFIPRTGDKVSWFYFPAPEVKDVRFDYEANEIIVTLKGE